MVKDHIQRGDYTYKIAPRLVFSAIRISDPIIGALLLLLFVESFGTLSDVFQNGPGLVDLPPELKRKDAGLPLVFPGAVRNGRIT